MLTSSAVPGVPWYTKCWVQSAGTWSAMFLSAVTVSAGYQECCPLSAALFLQVLLVFSEKTIGQAYFEQRAGSVI